MLFEALTRAIETRDPYTRGHSARVSALAEALARRLGCDHGRVAAVRLGAPLHDIGKVAVSDEVLLKPGRLSPRELAEIRLHPTVGARLVQPLRALTPALPCILYHHERWDGCGYPSGRARDQIPLEARILAVADSFDAMTTTRPYRVAMSPESALEEVDRCAGSQFDPAVARAFLDGWETGAIGVDGAASEAVA